MHRRSVETEMAPLNLSMKSLMGPAQEPVRLSMPEMPPRDFPVGDLTNKGNVKSSVEFGSSEQFKSSQKGLHNVLLGAMFILAYVLTYQNVNFEVTFHVVFQSCNLVTFMFIKTV